MSLLAEVVVEEWLNRQGYFTIRGAKLGVDEIDILAMRSTPNGNIERRHIEVQVSTRPISYISVLPKSKRDSGRPANTPKRTREEIVEGVQEWVEKKFHKQNKKQLFTILGGDSVWSQELVIHNVKSQGEVELIRAHGIKILNLSDIVKELRSSKTPIKAAAGAELLELMHLAAGDVVIAEAIEAVSEA